MGLRQGKRTFTNHIEIFEVTRPVSAIFAGHTLRIVDREHFHMVYTLDDWATTLDGGVPFGGVSGVVCGYSDAGGSGGRDSVYAELAGAGSPGTVVGQKY